MGGVRQVSLDPLRTKRVFECLYYHGKDLCVGCREMLCSTLSHRSEVTETCPGRENQQILGTLETPAQAGNDRAYLLHTVLGVAYLGCPCLTGRGSLEQILGH